MVELIAKAPLIEAPLCPREPDPWKKCNWSPVAVSKIVTPVPEVMAETVPFVTNVSSLLVPGLPKNSVLPETTAEDTEGWTLKSEAVVETVKIPAPKSSG